MVGCSMWYTLQMVTMVVLLWRLIMMGRLHIQNTMDMEDMGLMNRGITFYELFVIFSLSNVQAKA